MSLAYAIRVLDEYAGDESKLARKAVMCCSIIFFFLLCVMADRIAHSKSALARSYPSLSDKTYYIM